MKSLPSFLCAFLLGMLTLHADSVSVSSLDLGQTRQGWSRPGVDKSVDGHPISIGGHTFDKGLGTHSPSVLYINLKGAATRFTASVGVDDEPSGFVGHVRFRVYGDGKLLWKSDVVNGKEQPVPVDLPLQGIKTLILVVENGGHSENGNHADWADARIETQGEQPETIPVPVSEPVILTPSSGPAPRINGPKVFGVRTGSPFLYTIPATGDRPMTFAADNLPPGLTLDQATGQITGSLSSAGECRVTLRASNANGKTEKPFRIVVGDAIALTPPMGWNSWNCWGGEVSQDKVASSAKALVGKGLRDHGWTYVNIDDGWQGDRSGPLNAIQPNSKFPDMPGLGKQIHDLGLKLGIYSTPWRGSYLGHIGSSSENEDGSYDWIKSGDHDPYFLIGRDAKASQKEHVANFHLGKYSFATNDAKQWGEWGIDYLKYDWNPIDVKSTQTMADALRATGRDIVYSLSNRAAFEHVGDWAQLSNAWRTTDDINDSWSSVSGIGFSQDKWASSAGPGHWNDPDMLVVGNVGWGHPHPTKLTPDEQYTHVSLWCLLSAPLLIGCDLNTLDDFTLNLLTNDEVLDVDQDSLGRQATKIVSGEDSFVYAKPLEDGSYAVGLFNTAVVPQNLSVDWSDLKIGNAQVVRDLWRQKDLGKFDSGYSTDVAPHGVVLIRISAAH